MVFEFLLEGLLLLTILLLNGGLGRIFSIAQGFIQRLAKGPDASDSFEGEIFLVRVNAGDVVLVFHVKKSILIG